MSAASDLREDRLERTTLTPEGVRLTMRLASPVERLLALVMDMLFIGLAFIVLALAALAVLAAGAGVRLRPAELAPGAGAVLLAGFALRYFYFTAFELTAAAATPGKRMFGLRVAARDGGALDASAVFVRNAMREVEVYLPLGVLGMRGEGVDALVRTVAVIWCLAFLLLPLLNRDRLRAGDIAAGTWVVRTPRRRLAADLAERARTDGVRFSPADLEAYGVFELQTLEAVLRARDPRTLGAVAGRIRAKLGRPPEPGVSDEAFLDAYYAALRARLERGLLMGRRRRDKFDAA